MSADEQYGAVLAQLRAEAADPPDYVVAVPSYRRADTIGHRTLATLERLRVDPQRVTVFTADEGEADTYDRAIGQRWTVAVGRPGLVGCRRYYSNVHYPAGTPILNLDDDVDDLLARTPDNRVAPWQGSLDQLAALGFGACRALGVGLWGVNGYANGLYMHDEAVAGLRYICGIIHGTFAGDRDANPDDEVPMSGEDFARTLRVFTAQGAVLRLDWLAPKTVYFGPGGMRDALGGDEDRARDHASQLRAIALRYPRLVSKVYRKADGNTNLKLKVVTSLRVPRASMERAWA